MASYAVPADIVWLCVLVLLYQIFCLSASVLLLYMLWRSGERFTYITLIALVITISTTSTMVQAIHYTFDWVEIKQAEYDRSVADANLPSYARRGSAEIVDLVLTTIENYSYNVVAWLILFWALALFKRTWNLKLRWLTERAKLISIGSKFFAICFPALTTGLARYTAENQLKYGYFFFINVNFAISLILGSILLILILYKYIKSRRQVAGRHAKTPWWRSMLSTTLSRSSPSANSTSGTSSNGIEPTVRKSDPIYDHALIMRFTIGFVALAIYEGIIVGYQALSITREETALLGPDLSRHTIIANVLFYIPGTTGSLVVFLVFGTTKSLRKYRAFLDPVCCCFAKRRRQGVAPGSGARAHPVVQKRGQEPLTLELPTARPDLESRGRPNNTYLESVTSGDSPGSEDRSVWTRTVIQKRGHEVQTSEVPSARPGLDSLGRLSNGDLERGTTLSAQPALESGSRLNNSDLDRGAAISARPDMDSPGRLNNGDLEHRTALSARPKMDSRSRLNNGDLEHRTALSARPKMDSRSRLNNGDLERGTALSVRSNMESRGRLNNSDLERGTAVNSYSETSWFDKPLPPIHQSDYAPAQRDARREESKRGRRATGAGG